MKHTCPVCTAQLRTHDEYTKHQAKHGYFRPTACTVTCSGRRLLTPVMPCEVLHYCRKCGASFEKTSKRHAHALLVYHNTTVHGFRTADSCHSNCSFKATFEETRQGRMLYGEGART